MKERECRLTDFRLQCGRKHSSQELPQSIRAMEQEAESEGAEGGVKSHEEEPIKCDRIPERGREGGKEVA